MQVTFIRRVTDPTGHPGYLLGARIGHPDRGFTRAGWDSPWPGAAFRFSGTYRRLFAAI